MQSVQILSNRNYPIGKIINQELQNSAQTQIAVAARKDKGLKKVIDDISEREQNLPGTIPSIKAMIIDFMKQELANGKKTVALVDIYKNPENRVNNSEYASYFKMDTFRNSIRGELNHNEIGNAETRSLHLFKREEKGVYSLSENGLRYEGR